jgi:hypothetical protein
MNIITIIAVDRDSSDTMSRSFSTNNEHLLKAMVEKWEEETIGYRKYYLTTSDCIDDFSEEVQEILDELEITE